MNKLPDFFVLDFCEWIKQTVLNNETEFDIWDLLFDKRYNNFIIQEAKKYCDKKREKSDDIKMILDGLVKLYYQSPEFSKVCQEIEQYSFDRETDILCSKLERSIMQFIYSQNENALKAEIRRYKFVNKNENKLPYILVDNLRYCYKMSIEKDDSRIPFIGAIVENKAAELEFLEWIKQKNIVKGMIEKIDSMPIDVFADFAHEFCKETNNGFKVEQELIKRFKKSEPGVLWRKLECLIPYSERYKKEPFKNIYQRYLSDATIYKCVILPTKSDYGKFHELVTKRWIDLNNVSGDYLDIYYCFADYGKTGHDLMRQLHSLSNEFWTKLPCIIIWKENIKKAKSISINELTVEDVYNIIAGAGGIVDLIIQGKTIDEIVKGANEMGEERRNKERPLNKYIQNAEGANNVQQNMIFGSVGGSIINSASSPNSNAFLEEIEKAIKLVVSSELDEVVKDELKSIFEEAKESVKENSKEKEISSKSKFSMVCKFAGENIKNILEILADFATVAAFLDWHTKDIKKCQTPSTMSIMNDGLISKVVYQPNEGKLLYSENGKFKDIDDLSAGYQSILNLILDLAYRMAILNPDEGENISKVEVIVFIDEIDSNLHPQWQWRVIDALTEIFPNIQFIAATHSPIIVSSCKDANIINLDENGNVRYITDSYAFSVNDILRYMLGYHMRPAKVENLIEEFEKRMDREE